MKEKINIFVNRLKERRKIVISNPSSFEQKFSITLTRSGFIFISLLTLLVFSFIVYLVIAFTPLRQYIPGYPNISNADKIHETDKNNLETLFLVQKRNNSRELWIKNLTNILSDNDSILLSNLGDTINTDSANYKNIIFERPIENSILREKVKQENILIEKNIIKGMLKKMNFLPPVKGSVINTNSLGIDFKTELNHPVKSSMKGVVVSKTKKSAIIQHDNNMISIYKNCLTLQLKVGDNISRGKQIGVVTDSILHFELWHNGKSINPKELFAD